MTLSGLNCIVGNVGECFEKQSTSLALHWLSRIRYIYIYFLLLLFQTYLLSFQNVPPTITTMQPHCRPPLFQSSLTVFFMPTQTEKKKTFGFHDCINWMNKLTLKDNTVSYCFALFICGGPCHLSSFKQCSGNLISLWEQTVWSVMEKIDIKYPF